MHWDSGVKRELEMYYSAVGILAFFVLFIENMDVMLNRNGAFEKPSWRVYRSLVGAVFMYYITDILWGFLYNRKLATLLFADTSVYFIVMALGIMFATQYIVTYLNEKTVFGRFLVVAGVVFPFVVTTLVIVNIFHPVLFIVDAKCSYRALPVRYALLGSQILLLISMAIYALSYIVRKGIERERKKRYRTLAWFSLIMAVFLTAQLWYPNYPLYAVAYMLGTTLLHVVVVGDEKEEYRQGLLEIRKNAEMNRKLGSLFGNMAQSLARNYLALFYVNSETGEFFEYRSGKDGELSEVRHEEDFFEMIRRDTPDFVHPEDAAMFMASMDRAKLKAELDTKGTFLLTYRRHPGADGPQNVSMRVTRMGDDPHFLIIGISDVDDQVNRRRAAVRMKEEHIAYARISALTGDFLCIYIVVPETGRYREYSSTDSFLEFSIPKEGMDFFSASRENGKKAIHPDDLERFLSLFTRENVFAEIEKSGLFVLSYRLIVDGQPRYIRLKAAMVEESEGKRLIVGLNDVDSQVRQEEAQERLLAQARKEAHTDALTGLRNKLSYLELEKRLNSQIAEYPEIEFAVVIFDVNNLKEINDSLGHQAGDQHLKEAAEVIGTTFPSSQVFRIGGDEFVVIARGTEYAHIDDLIDKIKMHNMSTTRYGGVVIACGMARFRKDANVAQVFRRADKSMYDDKAALKTYLSSRSSSSDSSLS